MFNRFCVVFIYKVSLCSAATSVPFWTPYRSSSVNKGLYIPKCSYKCVDYWTACCSCDFCGPTSLFKMASNMAAKIGEINVAVIYDTFWYQLNQIWKKVIIINAIINTHPSQNQNGLQNGGQKNYFIFFRLDLLVLINCT